MIARLKGLVEEKSNGNVIVDVQGVGYGVHVPETVFLRLPEVGGEVVLQIHTHVREDHITLYGFLTHLERDTFEILMSASGVGPKLALTILSALEAGQVIEAVSTGNKMLFNGISGVGKKNGGKALRGNPREVREAPAARARRRGCRRFAQGLRGIEYRCFHLLGKRPRASPPRPRL